MEFTSANSFVERKRKRELGAAPHILYVVIKKQIFITVVISYLTLVYYVSSVIIIYLTSQKVNNSLIMCIMIKNKTQDTRNPSIKQEWVPLNSTQY